MNTPFLLTVGGVTSIEDVLQRPAQTIVVNNYSNQWVELPGIAKFVPPYWVGAQYPAEGTNRAIAKFNSPTGIPQAATIAAQECVVEYFEEALQPNSGQPITVRAPSTEWRNPKGLVFAAANAVVGPSGVVIDWSYTVPAGRRARLDSAQVVAEIFVSDGSGSGTTVAADVNFSPLGAASTTFVQAAIITGTVVGARADAALASSKELQATDVVFGLRSNLRGAGVTVIFEEIATLTEGDA